MSYIKSGKSVMELFRNRGWDAIIADDLVGNCLFFVSVAVGLLMAGVGTAVAAGSDFFDEAGDNAKAWAALIGFLVGLVITSILMSAIASAVNAVIVLFAEAPSEFQQNHPDLSTRMRQIWGEIYPGSV
jgi:Plasma-membrane choline transporter